MIERVRAILITPAGTLLTIRRIRPGMDPYWVLPGGHVEPGDADLQAALRREIREELAAEIEIVSLLRTVESGDDRQSFYLATTSRWSFADRTGPEFSEAGRGDYHLAEIPLTTGALDEIDLKPAEIAAYIREELRRGDLSAVRAAAAKGLG